jgi:hypothetical protein
MQRLREPVADLLRKLERISGPGAGFFYATLVCSDRRRGEVEDRLLRLVPGLRSEDEHVVRVPGSQVPVSGPPLDEAQPPEHEPLLETLPVAYRLPIRVEVAPGALELLPRPGHLVSEDPGGLGERRPTQRTLELERLVHLSTWDPPTRDEVQQAEHRQSPARKRRVSGPPCRRDRQLRMLESAIARRALDEPAHEVREVEADRRLERVVALGLGERLSTDDQRLAWTMSVPGRLHQMHENGRARRTGRRGSARLLEQSNRPPAVAGVAEPVGRDEGAAAQLLGIGPRCKSQRLLGKLGGSRRRSTHVRRLCGFLER